MKKADHTRYRQETAESDWLAAHHLFNARRHLQCLFFAHRTIGKLGKAHWVQGNVADHPPRTHNIIRLWTATRVVASTNHEDIAVDLNRFQAAV